MEKLLAGKRSGVSLGNHERDVSRRPSVVGERRPRFEERDLVHCTGPTRVPPGEFGR
jgi:hypothetical protein